jgi:hypothetical protein
MMKISSILLLALATSFPLLAQEKSKSSPIDPNALAPLKRMSATLAAAKAFSYHSKTILEVPAATGQFITLVSTGKVTLQRPNKLVARLGGDAPPFDFFYDGTTVSAFAPETKVYSSAKAPATIDAMLSGLQTETGIRFPTSPLLFTNPYSVLTRGLFSAVVVGPSNVDGVTCEHLAFRSPGVNWEIWLDPDPRALPRRMAVTFTDRENFPRTIIEFSGWNLHPWFLGDGTFAFRAPAGAKEIPFTAVLKSADR